MKVSEVCNANMTCLSIDIVHSLVKSQTSFQAGELKHFLPQWGQGSYSFSETNFQDFSRTFQGPRLIFEGL